jgi:hypothetical protein
MVASWKPRIRLLPCTIATLGLLFVGAVLIFGFGTSNKEPSKKHGPQPPYFSGPYVNESAIPSHIWCVRISPLKIAETVGYLLSNLEIATMCNLLHIMLSFMCSLKDLLGRLSSSNSAGFHEDVVHAQPWLQAHGSHTQELQISYQ